MPHYFTEFTTDEEVDSAALNSRFTELDDQLFDLASGTGYENQTANLIFAGPNTGSPAAPSFRALVAADLATALTMPPAIGGTTPAAGTFTTLQANTSLLVNTTGEMATFGTGSGSARIVVRGAAGNSREIRLSTGTGPTSPRWGVLATSTAESGSEAGTNFGVARYNDAGSFVDLALQIIRSSGEVQVENALKVKGNIGFFNTSPGSKPTITGSRGSNAALASLLTAGATLGLWTDSTS